MIRKRHIWKFRGQSLELGPRTLIVAVLNVTPDSFSDGGEYSDPEAAAARALELQDQGADIIDIGAESTRPGSARLTEDQELHRLIPVLKRIKGRLDIPVSVDTYKPGVAQRALEYGVQIINDVSGLTWQPELARVVANADAGLILNHMRGAPETWAKLPPMRNVLGEIASETEASLHRAVKAGIPADHIVIDPGIGFGKRREQNAEILARLTELSRLAAPILVGPSRKSFLAQETPEGTEFATAAAVTAAILNGAYLIRVHNVPAMKAVAATCDAILTAIPEREATPVTRVARRDAEGRVREPAFGDEQPKRPVRPPVPPRERDQQVRDKPLFRPRESDSEQRPQDRPRETRPPREGDRPAYGRGRPPREYPRDDRGREDKGQYGRRSGPPSGSPPKQYRDARTGDKPFQRGGSPPDNRRGDRTSPGGDERPEFRSGYGKGRPFTRDAGGRPPRGTSGGRPQGSGGGPPRKRSGPPGAGRRGPNTPPRRNK